MKYFTISLFLFITSSYAQTRDTRASLEVFGTDEISVAPDGKICVATRGGELFYTNNINETWHYGFVSDENKDEYNRAMLERINFFDSQKAILTGYINGNDKHKKSGLYLTENGGKDWKPVNFGGDAWIYTAYTNPSGKAWIGGSSGNIHYTENFGKNWEQLRSPYDQSSRLFTIFMLDDKNGISGALHNLIYKTDDNWQSFTKIKTPIDQKKYDGEKDDRVQKVIYWQHYIVVKQNGHVFYTEANDINWKVFPVRLNDFVLKDDDRNALFGVTKDLKVVLFTGPEEYSTLNGLSAKSGIMDIKSVGDALFIMDNNDAIHRVTTGSYQHEFLYTTDHPIKLPVTISHGNGISWGATYNELYLSDSKGSYQWYRENKLDFPIRDIIVKSDSTALLWDGERNSYMYSLKTHKATLHHPENPIGEFLKSPVKTLTIEAGSRGCFHHFSDSIIYHKKDNLNLESTGAVVESFKDTKNIPFPNVINTASLEAILTSYNTTPEAIPLISDFHITQKDKEGYLKMVNDRLKTEFNGFNKSDQSFYKEVLNRLDNLSQDTLAAVLSHPENIQSTTTNWYKITIENEAGKQLEIRQYYYVNFPWQLPWQINYNSQNFTCYSLKLSQLINSAIPEKFFDKDLFDNRWLIMKIADYLNAKRHQEE